MCKTLEGLTSVPRVLLHTNAWILELAFVVVVDFQLHLFYPVSSGFREREREWLCRHFNRAKATSAYSFFETACRFQGFLGCGWWWSFLLLLLQEFMSDLVQFWKNFFVSFFRSDNLQLFLFIFGLCSKASKQFPFWRQWQQHNKKQRSTPLLERIIQQVWHGFHVFSRTGWHFLDQESRSAKSGREEQTGWRHCAFNNKSEGHQIVRRFSLCSGERWWCRSGPAKTWTAKSDCP